MSDLYSTYLNPYKEWLETQNMTSNSLRAYCSRIKQFLIFVECTQMPHDLPLKRQEGLNNAIASYLQFLKQSERERATINANINALKSFAAFLGLMPAKCKREPHLRKPSATLRLEEQERLLSAINQQKSVRDTAMALVLFNTGLRIGACAKLTVKNVDVAVSAINLDNGYRIPLNRRTSIALTEWLVERQKIGAENESLWLTQNGEALSIAGIAFVIRRIAWEAKLNVSAQTLRRTWLANTTSRMKRDQLAMKFGGFVSPATIVRYGFHTSI